MVHDSATQYLTHGIFLIDDDIGTRLLQIFKMTVESASDRDHKLRPQMTDHTDDSLRDARIGHRDDGHTDSQKTGVHQNILMYCIAKMNLYACFPGEVTAFWIDVDDHGFHSGFPQSMDYLTAHRTETDDQHATGTFLPSLSHRDVGPEGTP